MKAKQSWAELFAYQVDRAGDAPLFRQIYLQIRAAILSRALRAGTKLPSTRALSLRLAVSRAAVVSAYEQLLAEGYASGRIGAGTYVAADLPEPFDTSGRHKKRSRTGRPAKPPRSVEDFVDVTQQSEERPFNLGRTLLDARSAELWRRLTARTLRSFGRDHLGYGDPRGIIALRQSVRDYVQVARGVQCAPEQIVITAGTQQAVAIVARLLPGPGAEVWVEDPGYPLTRHALVAIGAKVRPVPVDECGLDVAAGIRRAPRAQAAFVTPSHQFPTGVVLSMARRLELLAWAREQGAWIIEDDYASEFRYGGRPLESLQGLDDAERVIYVGTLNKALFPGLRLGYAVVPPALMPHFVAARYLIDRQPPSLCQAVAAAFMEEGHFAAHIRRMRELYRGQRDALVSALRSRLGDDLIVDPPDQGMHLVAYTRRRLSDVAIEHSARRRCVVVRAMSRLHVEAPARMGLMMGFSGYPAQLMAPAVARLAQCFER
jgi:GntR family transcriptional regulator/MocR family aminotransferase